MELNWILKKFEDLTTVELYAILKLRNEVFVVEQNCIYQDADDKDPFCYHFMGLLNENLVAYTRIIPPGISYEYAGIGRVVISPLHRKKGVGKELMKLSINNTFSLFDCPAIKIGAQVYLNDFYTTLGFEPCSNPYLEDGIPHIEMLLKK